MNTRSKTNVARTIAIASSLVIVATLAAGPAWSQTLGRCKSFRGYVSRHHRAAGGHSFGNLQLGATASKEWGDGQAAARILIKEGVAPPHVRDSLGGDRTLPPLSNDA